MLQHKKQLESAKIRKGGLKHMGFAFSGEDQSSSTLRGLTIVGDKKKNNIGGFEEIEEEKQEDSH